MKIKPSALVGAMSGKLNGGVLRTLGNSCVATTMPRKPLNASQAQLHSRAIYNDVKRRWASFSEIERQQWELFALSHPIPGHFGQQVTQSGFNAYMQRSLTTKLNGSAVVTEAPQDVPMPAPHDLILFIDIFSGGLDMVFQWEGTPSANNPIQANFFLTSNIGATRKPLSREFKFISRVVYRDEFVDLLDPYIEVFPTPREGDIIYWRMNLFNTETGQRSLDYSGSAVATPA